MGDLGPDIHRPVPPPQRIEIFAEAFPAPGHALVKRGAGNILDPFHQLDQPILTARPHRREADPAIAHDHCGHAMPARWGKLLVPGRLTVIMRVHIDKARRDKQAAGVDHRFARLRRKPGTNFGDYAALKADIGLDWRTAVAICERSATDQGAGHGQSLNKAMTRNSTLERGWVTGPGSGWIKAPWIQPTGASGSVSHPLKMTISSWVICE